MLRLARYEDIEQEFFLSISDRKTDVEFQKKQKSIIFSKIVNILKKLDIDTPFQSEIASQFLKFKAIVVDESYLVLFDDHFPREEDSAQLEPDLEQYINYLLFV